jgi:predicted nucleotidyltransferase
MRLSQSQLATITQTTTAVVGPLARVSIFGSRLDDSRVGGDVDLLIESKPAIGLLARAKIKWLLEQELNLPVDVVAADLDDVQTPFVAIARAHSRCLNDVSSRS